MNPTLFARSSVPVVVVVAVFDPDGAMLWGQRADDGLYTTPAGHVEPGERLRPAAVRELREEAGIVADPAQLHHLGVRKTRRRVVVVCYRLDLGERPPTDSSGDPDHEVPAWRWVQPVAGQLPPDVGGALHVPRENALLDFLGMRAGGLQLAKAELVVGRNHPGLLLHGTTKRSAKAFVAGTPLPDRQRNKTLSEFGEGVIYASDPDAPHQAAMFASGPDRTMVEFKLKPGTKIMDFSREMARRPFVGGHTRTLAFSGRPAHTDDMAAWLKDVRQKRGKPELSTDELASRVDPTHPSFVVDDYAGMLPSYVRDRGFHGFRFQDETVLADPSAIASARHLKPHEIDRVRQRPRSGTPTGPGALYSEIEKAEPAPRDVVVCIPKSRQAQVEQEEQDVARTVAAGQKAPTYWWSVHKLPRQQPRRVYFVWDGSVRAYHDCVGVVEQPNPRLLLDHIIHSIKPVQMDAFRGWRYYGSTMGKAEDLVASVVLVKAEPQKRYTNAEMVAVGADGHFPHAVRMHVPIDQVGGLEPVPAADTEHPDYPTGGVSDELGYKPGQPIRTPVEVEYHPGVEEGKNFALHSGNHRLRQARVNGQTHIEAFVHHPRGNYLTMSRTLGLHKAISELRPGKPGKEPQTFDYSHLLPAGAKAKKYKLRVEERPSEGQTAFRVSLHHPSGEYGKPSYSPRRRTGEVGGVGGALDANGSLEVHESHLDECHQGKGFGKAMYEALLAHAHQAHGAKEVIGTKHSTMASRVHSSLARKHGLGYAAQPDFGPNSDTYETLRDWKAGPTGPNDEKYKPYQYAIKAEPGTLVTMSKAPKKIIRQNY